MKRVGPILVLGLVAGAVASGCRDQVAHGGSSPLLLGPSSVSTVASAPPSSAAPTPAPPPGPPAVLTLQSLSITPSTIQQQGQPKGVVTFGAPVESSTLVTLESSDAGVAKVPPSVTVPAQESTASFTVDTASVAVNITVTIYAKYGGVTRSATLTVTAPEPRPNPSPAPAPPPQKDPSQNPPPCRDCYLLAR